MPTPRAVKRAEKRAEELHAQAYNVQPDDPPADDPPTDPPQDDPPSDPPADPPLANGGDPAPDAQPAADEVDWQQKFSVMNGKYNSEVPRLVQRIKELEAQQTKAPASPPPADTLEVGELTDAELQDWGPETVDMVRKVSGQLISIAVSKAVAPLVAQLDKLSEQLSTVDSAVAETTSTSFMDRVRTRVNEFSNFDKQNYDEGFTAWLATVVRGTGGLTRQQLLNSAFTNKNVDEVVDFFHDYVNEKEAAKGGSGSEVVSRRGRGSVDPKSLVEPPSRTSDPGAPVRQRQPPTEQDWQKLYSDRRRGVIDEAEYAKREKQMHDDMYSAVPG